MGGAVAPKTRGGGRQRRRPVSDINVTPMVDVMLVLLVIFMVTAPLLTTGVQVDLPKTSDSAPPIKGEDKPISVTVDGHGEIWLQQTKIEINDLTEKMRAITKEKPDTRIFIRGDKAIDYGRVMEVMSKLGAAGFSKVALITETGQSTAPGAKKPQTNKGGGR